VFSGRVGVRPLDITAIAISVPFINGYGAERFKISKQVTPNDQTSLLQLSMDMSREKRERERELKFHLRCLGILLILELFRTHPFLMIEKKKENNDFGIQRHTNNCVIRNAPTNGPVVLFGLCSSLFAFRDIPKSLTTH
jgi:hypothetical protein